MDLLLLTFTAGWASGINAYLAAFLLGVCGKLGADLVPEALQRTDVLVVLGVLAVVEIVAQKVPYLDSAWDAIQTPLRIAAGAGLGALIAGVPLEVAGQDVQSYGEYLLASVGGVTALLSHAAKSGIRLAVNSSPEPASNIIVSSFEDLLVSGAVVLAILAPVIAAGLAGIALVISLILAAVLFKLVRKGWKRIREYRASRRTVAA